MAKRVTALVRALGVRASAALWKLHRLALLNRRFVMTRLLKLRQFEIRHRHMHDRVR